MHHGLSSDECACIQVLTWVLIFHFFFFSARMHITEVSSIFLPYKHTQNRGRTRAHTLMHTKKVSQGKGGCDEREGAAASSHRRQR